MTFSRHTSLLAGALATVALVAPAFAQDAKAVFDPLYAQMNAATEARDMATLNKLMAPEFEMIDIRGDSHTLGEMSEMMASIPKDPAMKPKYTILSAAITGTSATVKNQTDMHVSRAMEDGTTAELDITMISEDTWVQRGEAWVMVKSVQKDLSVAKDGEVVFHQAV
jgi:Domain of unknown function (DUF4440)